MAAAKPVLLFDGDCGFCRLWIERWRLLTGDAVVYEASQDAGKDFPQIPPASFAEAVFLVEPKGKVSRGAEAVFRSLSYAGGGHRAWRALYERVPPFRAAGEAAYRVVAAHRPLFSRLTRLLWGASPVPARADGTARAVAAGVGLCYLAAFVSLGVQVRGLIGKDGLLPAVQYLDAASQRLGLIRYWAVPSFAWLASSDRALVALCAAGALASLGLVLNMAAGPCALACWALYLSLCSIGSDFLSFQWDILLLEAGLITVFLVPWSRRGGWSRGALFLLRLLLFKLMLQSGLVKLLSGDPNWRHLTALTYHYWSQPLPNPPAWYANLLPLWAQKISCALMLSIELGAPWLLFFPRNPRRLGAAAIAVLMILIAATGNYGFFNLLTLALCLTAFDDSVPFLARLAPAKASALTVSRLRSRALAVWAALWLCVSGTQEALHLGIRPRPVVLWDAFLAAAEPLRSINSYGLFAVMTTTRDEIVLEVSADGTDWREWPFKYKPGDPRRAPPWAAPHMPRLDWQMWFASLGAPSPWLSNLVFRLLSGGDKDVEDLLGPPPLGDVKPAYARGFVYATRFSTPEERRADGSWWHRERKGLAFPVVSLKAR